MEIAHTSAGGSGLPGIQDLFSSAWKTYKAHWKLLLGFGFLPAVLFLLIATLGAGGMMSAVALQDTTSTSFGFGMLVILLFVGVGVLSMATSAAQAFVAAAEHPVSFREGFQWGFSRLLSMLGLALLQGLLVLLVLIPFLVVAGIVFFLVSAAQGNVGGIASVVFALLFVILCALFVLLGIRLMFIWPLVVLKESAVVRSFQESWRLSSGRFWALFGRVAVAMLLSVVINMILGFIPIVGSLLQVVVSAYFLVYFVLLFRATQRAAGTAPVMPAAPGIAPAAR